jgi:hypothetical protein
MPAVTGGMVMMGYETLVIIVIFLVPVPVRTNMLERTVVIYQEACETIQQKINASKSNSREVKVSVTV